MNKRKDEMWKKIWKDFNRMLNAAEYFMDNEWQYQNPFFYTAINMHSKKKLWSYDIKPIERKFKKWYDNMEKYDKYWLTWKDQEKKLRELVEEVLAKK